MIERISRTTIDINKLILNSKANIAVLDKKYTTICSL